MKILEPISISHGISSHGNSINKRVYESIEVNLCSQGHGIRNTHNLASKCFRNPSTFSESLGLDKTLGINMAHTLICFKINKKVN